MTTQTANALYRYFKALYDLNQTVMMLGSIEETEEMDTADELIEKVILLVPRIIPYGKGKNKQTYTILSKDGLCEFQEDLPFLKENYQRILQNHLRLLSDIKNIRNKLEHQMHGAVVLLKMCGNHSLFQVMYEKTDQPVLENPHPIVIDVASIIALVKDLNTLFSEIQKELKQFASDHDFHDHPCYKKLTRVPFHDLNKICDSELLRVFGKMMFPF